MSGPVLYGALVSGGKAYTDERLEGFRVVGWNVTRSQLEETIESLSDSGELGPFHIIIPERK